MRYTSFLGLLAAVCLAAPVRAEVLVNTPWVTVHVGRPLPPAVIVRGYVPAESPTLPLPPPVPVESVTVPGAAVVVGGRPPTLEEFAESFHAAPGHYEVVVLNPVTCCPVKVCFTLPCGCPCKVKVHARTLEFCYGLFNKVSIHFHHDGDVTVRD